MSVDGEKKKIDLLNRCLNLMTKGSIIIIKKSKQCLMVGEKELVIDKVDYSAQVDQSFRLG